MRCTCDEESAPRSSAKTRSRNAGGLSFVLAVAPHRSLTQVTQPRSKNMQNIRRVPVNPSDFKAVDDADT
jgi:hypothetical protein